jgi:hypothetical protein
MVVSGASEGARSHQKSSDDTQKCSSGRQKSASGRHKHVSGRHRSSVKTGFRLQTSDISCFEEKSYAFEIRNPKLEIRNKFQSPTFK